DSLDSRCREGSVLLRNEALAQDPGRLYGHADAFGHDRVRFARGVADHKNTVVTKWPDSRPDGPRRQPRSIPRRAGKRRVDSAARSTNVREYGFGRPGVAPLMPASLQVVAADAA